MSFTPPAVGPSTPSPLPTAGTWNLDRNHSTVLFSILHHQVANFRATFVNIDGSFDGASQKLVGEVAASDVTIPREALIKHLMGPDFFNAEEFPTFSFESTKFTKDGELLAVEGLITLRGVTKPITAIGTYHPQRTVKSGLGVTNERFGIDLAATIDRRDFGISFNNWIAEGVANLGWLVKIDAALEFIENVDH